MTAGDLAELIDAHAAALALFARTWCASPEDVVQEAFCKLVGESVPPNDAKAWLFRVVRNGAIDAGKQDRRRRNREQWAAKASPWFDEVAVDGLDAAEAVTALQQLPMEQREVVVARIWGEMTLEQIAEAIGCSVSTAHRRYEAGLTILRQRLGAECPRK